MRVIFMGTPDFAVGTLRALVEAGHEVVGVVTQPDKPKGRGKTLCPTPVKEEALRYGLNVYQPVKIREEEVQRTLEALHADVMVVVAFGQILPKRILEMTPYGCINVHASLLPKYRGAAPIQWAVIDGEKESGVTIMRMDEGLDTGDMITKEVVELAENETGGSLFDRLSLVGAELLVKTLELLENGKAVFEPQPEESPTDYAQMIQKQMGCIDWEKSAAEIERLIRGMNPWPSAYTYLNGKTLKIWSAAVEDQILEEESLPGTIYRTDKRGLHVSTGDRGLCIRELQLEGKKRMQADAFLRGYEIEPGTRLSKTKE